MGIIGQIGSKIGKIASEQAEKAAAKKAENAQKRAESEESKQAAGSAFDENGKPFQIDEDEVGKGILEAFTDDLLEDANAAAEYMQAAAEDLATDVGTTIGDIGADAAAAAGTAAEAAGTVGAAIAGGLRAIGEIFIGGAEEGVENYDHGDDDSD